MIRRFKIFSTKFRRFKMFSTKFTEVIRIFAEKVAKEHALR